MQTEATWRGRCSYSFKPDTAKNTEPRRPRIVIKKIPKLMIVHNETFKSECFVVFIRRRRLKIYHDVSAAMSFSSGVHNTN